MGKKAKFIFIFRDIIKRRDKIDNKLKAKRTRHSKNDSYKLGNKRIKIYY